MQPPDKLDEPHAHPTSVGVTIPGDLTTVTFHCGNVVIRLTCNEPSKAAVENFQAALHAIPLSHGREGANWRYS
ncbi:hypothetical protein AYW79_13865 [Ferroacidibacillus organovorans]|uniref:Uncharacterized protein n=1 Tax=Ferroacidibacillus organovorans TaxID=1765683 RepID=A0A853K7F5_9BACL|nr:hypothetical protein AYJ22_14400 [Ferroacidibacillus organovorans]OAG91130.1 hypothetical protein AYW79_13865 [Ferroacidibacillus organovorans]